MERTQFTFYASMRESIRRIKNKNARADAYDAICDYALFGIEPDLDKLPDSAAIAFISAKPNLDASRRKAESGRRGGSRQENGKQNESNGEANVKQEKTRSEKENEIENEIENECSPPTPPHAAGEGSQKQNPLYDSDVATVMNAYMDKVNPTPSSVCTSELLDFLNDLDADVICHAIDVAVDENKRSWNYIKAILRRYRLQRLRHMADVLRDDEHGQHQSRGQADDAGTTNNPFLKIYQAEQREEGCAI